MESKGKQLGIRGKWKYISDLWTQTKSQIFTGTKAVWNLKKKCKEFLSPVITWRDLTFKHSFEEHSQIWLANKVVSSLFLIPPGQSPFHILIWNTYVKLNSSSSITNNKIEQLELNFISVS